jgi:hypothetical protein
LQRGYNNCMWDLSSCKRSKASKTKILDLKCASSKLRGRRISHCFVRMKHDRQLFFHEFGMSILKFENRKQLLHTDTGKKNTQWGCSITEEIWL